jgi:hypothetical protein
VVVFREDAGYARFDTLPQLLALLNSVVLSIFRITQLKSPSQARQWFCARSDAALGVVLSALP